MTEIVIQNLMRSCCYFGQWCVPVYAWCGSWKWLGPACFNKHWSMTSSCCSFSDSLSSSAPPPVSLPSFVEAEQWLQVFALSLAEIFTYSISETMKIIYNCFPNPFSINLCTTKYLRENLTNKLYGKIYGIVKSKIVNVCVYADM